MRLIDVDGIKIPKGFFEKVENVPMFYEWLNNLPTIDPAENGGCWGCCCEKLGQWRTKKLDKFRKYEVVCSECGAKYIGNYDAYDEPCEFNYCPNCGARMDIE